jgi:hypothetical protein
MTSETKGKLAIAALIAALTGAIWHDIHCERLAAQDREGYEEYMRQDVAKHDLIDKSLTNCAHAMQAMGRRDGIGGKP